MLLYPHIFVVYFISLVCIDSVETNTDKIKETVVSKLLTESV